MAKSGNIFKLVLSDDEQKVLHDITDNLSEDIGIDVSMSWVIRNMLMFVGGQTIRLTPASRALFWILKQGLQRLEGGN